MERFYVNWVEGTNGGYGRPIESLELAKKEAKRLAMLPANEGKPVRVLQLVGTFTCAKPVWEQAESIEIPF